MKINGQQIELLIREALNKTLCEADLPPITVPEEEGYGMPGWALPVAGGAAIYGIGRRAGTKAAAAAAPAGSVPAGAVHHHYHGGAPPPTPAPTPAPTTTPPPTARGGSVGSTAPAPGVAGRWAAAGNRPWYGVSRAGLGITPGHFSAPGSAVAGLRSIPAAGLRGAPAAAYALGAPALGVIPGAYVGAKLAPHLLAPIMGKSVEGVKLASEMGAQRIGHWLGMAPDPGHSQIHKRALDKGWDPLQTKTAIAIYDAGGVNTPEGKAMLADLKKQLDAKGTPPEETETITTDPVTSQEAADVATQVAEDAVVDETVQPEPVPEEQNAYIVKLDPLVGRTTRVKVYIEKGMSAEDVRREAKKKFARSKYKELMAAHPGLTKRDIRKIRKAYMKAANKMEDVTQVGVGPGEDLGLPLQETIHRLISEIRQEQRK